MVVDQVTQASVGFNGVKYAVVDVVKLLELLQWSRNGCKCGKKFHQFLMNRSVGRSKNQTNLYIPKDYGVTRYYDHPKKQ
jgi:hypothetical protein